MNLNNIERKFVFKISRGLFLFTTTIIALGLIGSILFFLYTMSPTIKAAEPVKPEPPASPQITADDINALIQSQTVAATPVPMQPEPVEQYESLPELEGEAISPQIQIEDLIEQVHAYFPEEGFPWQSTWKQKGVKDRLAWSFAYLKDEDKVIFLKTLLKFLSVMPSELHYNTVQSIGDICRAYRSTVPEVYDTLFKFFTGELDKAPDAQPVPLSNDQKAIVLNFIFKITKRNTPSDTFIATIKHWKQLSEIIAQDKLEDTMVAMWKVLEGMEASQAEATISTFEKILPQVPPDHQISALYIYQNLLYKKNRAQQQDFQRKMADYRNEVSKREMEYNTKIASKKGLRMSALYGIGSAIVGIAFLGLLLALLGIERNTRTLQALLEKIDSPSRGVDLGENSKN